MSNTDKVIDCTLRQCTAEMVGIWRSALTEGRNLMGLFLTTPVTLCLICHKASANGQIAPTVPDLRRINMEQKIFN